MVPKGKDVSLYKTSGQDTHTRQIVLLLFPVSVRWHLLGTQITTELSKCEGWEPGSSEQGSSCWEQGGRGHNLLLGVSHVHSLQELGILVLGGVAQGEGQGRPGTEGKLVM